MPDKIPNKLIFSVKSDSRKKKTLLLVIVLTLIQLCLIWPIYPQFASAKPFILGLPLSFAWVIAWVIISFFTMLSYFLYDTNHKES